jgi:hypothetical protein
MRVTSAGMATYTVVVGGDAGGGGRLYVKRDGYTGSTESAADAAFDL